MRWLNITQAYGESGQYQQTRDTMSYQGWTTVCDAVCLLGCVVFDGFHQWCFNDGTMLAHRRAHNYRNFIPLVISHKSKMLHEALCYFPLLGQCWVSVTENRSILVQHFSIAVLGLKG